LDDGSWRTLYDIQQEGKAASMSRYATSYIDDSLLTDKSMDEADVRKTSPPPSSFEIATKNDGGGGKNDDEYALTREQAMALFERGKSVGKTASMAAKTASDNERGMAGGHFAWPPLEEQAPVDQFQAQWESITRTNRTMPKTVGDVSSIISRALRAAGVFESPMIGRPQQGTCSWWIDGVTMVEVVLDTGAQDHSCSTLLSQFMSNVEDSQIKMKGAFGGKGVLAAERGELDMVMFTEDLGAAVQMGRECMKFDTIPGATWNLMSGAVLFELGFDINLTRKGGHQLVRENDDGTKTVLPFEYDGGARTWIGRVLVSRQRGQAMKMCRRILERVRSGLPWRFFEGRFLTPTIKAQIIRWARTESVTRRVEVVSRAQTRSQAESAKNLREAKIEIEPISDRKEDLDTHQGAVDSVVSGSTANDSLPAVLEPAHEPTEEWKDLVDKLGEAMDSDITAVKPFMHPREKGLKVGMLHRRWCHIGCNRMGNEKCSICEQLNWAHRQVRRVGQPFIPTVPMAWFTLDSCYIKPTTRWGCNYVHVCRGMSEGLFLPPIWTETRENFVPKLEAMLEGVRSDPTFRKISQIMTHLSLDAAGEWGPWMEELQSMATRMRIKIVHVPGDGDKRTAAYHEIAVRHFITRMKAALMES